MQSSQPIESHARLQISRQLRLRPYGRQRYSPRISLTSAHRRSGVASSTMNLLRAYMHSIRLPMPAHDPQSASSTAAPVVYLPLSDGTVHWRSADLSQMERVT
jgi:hypothetical protein